MTNKLDLPDESNDTPLQSRLRTLWHDNFNEPEFILEAETLVKVEVAKAKIAENRIQLSFNINAEKAEKLAGYETGFEDAINQFVKYRDLRIDKLYAEVESNGGAECEHKETGDDKGVAVCLNCGCNFTTQEGKK